VDGNIFTYMFCPQFGKRRGIFRPYGQALFGGAHSDVYSKAYSNLGFTQFGSAPASNAFAMDFGAGLDIAVSPRISIRPFEASYLRTTFDNHLSANENSTRFLAGVVFNMGVKPPQSALLRKVRRWRQQPLAGDPRNRVLLVSRLAHLSRRHARRLPRNLSDLSLVRLKGWVTPPGGPNSLKLKIEGMN